MVIATPLQPEPPQPAGGRLVSVDGRTLPLQKTELRADASGGLCRVVLEQHFQNVHADALHVSYQLPLPADAAVGGFAFELGDKLIVGEVDEKQVARERFERAIASGQTAALLEQNRTSLFKQELGNIPPGETIVCRVEIDQPLQWLGEDGRWEWRFPTVVGPRYMGGDKTPDARQITVDVSEGPLDARVQLGLTIGDTICGRIESPSHSVDLVEGEQGQRVRFRRDARQRLDRDIVVRWPVEQPEVGATLLTTRHADDKKNEGFGLLTLVPPQAEKRGRPVPRDLIFLIDTSGSMQGRPLEQTARVVSSMIESLRDEDRIELVEFSWAPHRWQPEPMPATAENRRAAIQWVNALEASGGTEMEQGIYEAMRSLRPGAQRQVILITDGYIGFEQRIVSRVLEQLPNNCRVHTVGVGSSVNRSLTKPVARAGGGVEVVIGYDEDPDRAAARMFARTDQPLVSALEISGSGVMQAVPRALPDLYPGAPALIGLRMNPSGGEVIVRGRTRDGSFEERLSYGPMLAASNPAVEKLFAREWVEDIETHRAAGGDHRELDQQITRVGIEHQISTRLTSWIAVTKERTVLEHVGQRREGQPHEIPHGQSVQGLGLRAARGDMKIGAATGEFEALDLARSSGAVLDGALEMDDEEWSDAGEEALDTFAEAEAAPEPPARRQRAMKPRLVKEKKKAEAPTSGTTSYGAGGGGAPGGPAQGAPPAPSSVPSSVREEDSLRSDLAEPADAPAEVTVHQKGAPILSESRTMKRASGWRRFIVVALALGLVALLVFLWFFFFGASAG